MPQCVKVVFSAAMGHLCAFTFKTFLRERERPHMLETSQPVVWIWLCPEERLNPRLRWTDLNRLSYRSMWHAVKAGALLCPCRVLKYEFSCWVKWEAEVIRGGSVEAQRKQRTTGLMGGRLRWKKKTVGGTENSFCLLLMFLHSLTAHKIIER